MKVQQRRTAARRNPTQMSFRAGNLGAMQRPLQGKTDRIVRILERFLGIPKPAPRRPSPLDILVATILSQNTNDKNSHRAYSHLRKRYVRWEDAARAPVRSIESAIRSGGMARQKAKRIKELLANIPQQGGSLTLNGLKEMDDDRALEYLMAFKGVGVKTASCVLLFSLGRDIFPVDTHVHRVCCRLGLSKGARLPEQTFDVMRSLVPRGKAYSFHTNLIRFGRLVCRSTNPSCSICPLYNECVFPGKGRRDSRRRVASKADHDFMLLDNV
jgi:endonuclease-3